MASSISTSKGKNSINVVSQNGIKVVQNGKTITINEKVITLPPALVGGSLSVVNGRVFINKTEIKYNQSIPVKPKRKLKIEFKFAWYDLWIGAFYERKRKVLYICPLPTLLIKLWYVNSQ